MAMEAIDNNYLRAPRLQKLDHSPARLKVLERLNSNRRELINMEESEEADDLFALNSYATMRMIEGWPIQDIDEVSAWIRKEIHGTFFSGKVMGT